LFVGLDGLAGGASATLLRPEVISEAVEAFHLRTHHVHALRDFLAPPEAGRPLPSSPNASRIGRPAALAIVRLRPSTDHWPEQDKNKITSQL
jgi:hypothetical protein